MLQALPALILGAFASDLSDRLCIGPAGQFDAQKSILGSPTGVVTIASNHIVSLRQAPSRRTVIAAAGIGFLGLMSGVAAASETRHAGSKHPHRAQPTDGKDAAVPGQTVGIASFYGAGESSRTASGERFNPHAMTAAHRTLPLGSSVKVTNLANGKVVVVRINDRGPYARGRVIDLSRSAAEALDFISRGLAKVRIETV